MAKELNEEELKAQEAKQKEQQEKMVQLEKENEQLNLLKQTLSQDPNVLKALEATRAGKQVGTVEEPAKRSLSQQISGDDVKPAVDLEDLNNTQLVALIVDKVSDAVESHVSGVEQEAVQKFEERLSVLDNNLTKTQKLIIAQAYKTSKDSVRAKYTDYSTYEKEVDAYVQAFGIPLEDAYRIVKSRHVSDELSAEETDSERPTGAATRRVVSRPDASASSSSLKEKAGQVKTRTAQRGRAGFRELLGRGIDEAIK